MKKYILSLVSLALMLAMASCGGRKDNGNTEDGTLASGVVLSDLSQVVTRINANRQQQKFLTSRMDLTLQMGSQQLSVGGSLRMKRDEVIQINLVYTLLVSIPVGTLEFGPDYVLVMDRINHQYVRGSYTDIPYLKQAGVDFYTFQSLFWDELFLAGERSKPSATSFAINKQGATEATLTSNASRLLALRFVADLARSMVTSTEVTFPGNANTSLQFQYGDYTNVGGHPFPQHIVMDMHSAGRGLKATFRLNNLRNDSNWETRTEVSKKYTAISMEAAFNRIMNFAR